MSHPIDVAFDNPGNDGILRHLRRREVSSLSVARHSPSCAPDAIDGAYLKLGTHPELVARLWDEITTSLPVRCNWVVYGTPVLVRPDTGIIFGFAGGTMYALRLPAIQRAELVAAAHRKAEENWVRLRFSGNREQYLNAQAGDVASFTGGGSLDITSIGSEWVFGRWLGDEPRWCHSAYENAA